MRRSRRLKALAAGVGEDSKKAFDFFGLPRELRDFVYDEVLRFGYSGKLSQDHGHIGVYTYNGPRPEDLLVSRQFRIEISERTSKYTELELNNYEPQELGEVQLPSGFGAAYLQLHLYIILEHPFTAMQVTEKIRMGKDKLLSRFEAKIVPFELNVHVYSNQNRDDYLIPVSDSLDSILLDKHRELLTGFNIYQSYATYISLSRPPGPKLVASYSHDTGELQPRW